MHVVVVVRGEVPERAETLPRESQFVGRLPAKSLMLPPKNKLPYPAPATKVILLETASW